jgi:hypothetical protein
MSHKELVADVRRFVEQTFIHVGGRRPSKTAMNRAAEKIAVALRPTLRQQAGRSR